MLPRLWPVRALLVPVKSFARAKVRLAGALGSAERRALAEDLASRVLRASSGIPAFVACDDIEVADWARSHGAEVLWTPGLGLSGAVSAGVQRLADLGFDLAIVSHADLPLVASFAGIGENDRVTLVPDRRLDGTNVACVPTAAGFRFTYGPASFSRHRAEARRLGLGPSVVYDWRLACDCDVPEDLVLLA
jgi:2-phospho-L-lactate guanylyltransferase